MTMPAKADWLIPGVLLGLGFVPMAAGVARLVQLGGGVQITAENARFFVAPWPVALHIISATVFCMLGALQFVPRLRRSHIRLHRSAGRWLVFLGLAAALTGLWITQFYPRGSEGPASFDGPAVYGMRLVVGLAMAVFLCLGVVAAVNRDLQRHQAWMMRGYALGLGAGTQVFTHLPWFVFPEIHGETARAVCMAAGWIINLAVAEWLISHVRTLARVGKNAAVSIEAQC